jgi:hypothetical protein
MKRGWLLALALAPAAGCSAEHEAHTTAPPPRPCPAIVAAPWRDALCAPAGSDGLWRALNALERPDTFAERTVFERNIAACAAGRHPGAAAARVQAETCVRRRLWARTTSLARRVDPGALTGVYRLEAARTRGSVEILERGDATAAFSLTVAAPGGAGCAVAISQAWRTGAAIAWKGELAPGDGASLCDIRLRRTGDDLLVESTLPCASACRGEATYQGRYRLQF